VIISDLDGQRVNGTGEGMMFERGIEVEKQVDMMQHSRELRAGQCLRCLQQIDSDLTNVSTFFMSHSTTY
jgi:hypothetical protein